MTSVLVLLITYLSCMSASIGLKAESPELSTFLNDDRADNAQSQEPEKPKGKEHGAIPLLA